MADRRQANQIEMLIRLDEQVKSLTKKVDDLINGMAKDVEILKTEKASKQDLTDLKFTFQNQMSELKDLVKNSNEEQRSAQTNFITRDEFDLLKEQQEKSVSKEEFSPVRWMAYGAAASIGAAFIAGLIKLIFK